MGMRKMRWALQELEAPTEEPVTLADAKLHLRVDGDEENTWIERAIRAAREFCEETQQRAYVSRRFRMSLERWPCGRIIVLPKPPLQSVEVITYILADGTVETLGPSQYVVDAASEPGTIYLAPGASWPAGQLAPGMPIRVEFTAGYGAAAAVPERVKQAILLLVGHWYENRETVLVGSISRSLEFAVEALLWQDRFWYSGPEG